MLSFQEHLYGWKEESKKKIVVHIEFAPYSRVNSPIVCSNIFSSTFIVVHDLANLMTLRSLRPRKTLNPSTNSNIMSTKLADTMIKSNMFQPQRKKSFDSAINLIIHSNVNIDVNTCWMMMG